VLLLALSQRGKLLVAQSKQCSLAKLPGLGTQAGFTNCLQRRYQRRVLQQGLACRRKHGQLRKALGVMSLAPDLKVGLHACARVIRVEEQRVNQVPAPGNLHVTNGPKNTGNEMG